ncbi:MAG TPA: CNNM domain-containing protein, partial [Solirubrobacteraceae bacterium]
MTALLLIAVLVLVFVNGFFVAAEFALVRLRPARLEELAGEGSKAARRALGVHEDLNQYLSACQFGITLASLGIGFLGEPAIAELIHPPMSAFVAVAIAYVLVTSLHVTTGEQVPKIFAILNAETTAMRVARPLIWFNALMRPFISALNLASNGILRAMRIDPEGASEEG